MLLPETGEFEPEKAHIKIMREVAASPSCTVSHVLSQLIPGHSEDVIRTGVRQLLSERYLDFDWGKSPPGVHLILTSEGRGVLLKTGIPVPIVSPRAPGNWGSDVENRGKERGRWNGR